jgi:hypothetical protein
MGEPKMPATILFDEQTTYVTDPINPTAGQNFTVSWQERNIGDENSGQYQDIFDLDDNGRGDSKTLDCDSLAAGAAATRTAKFSLPAGNYTMTLVINGGAPGTLGNVIIDDPA